MTVKLIYTRTKFQKSYILQIFCTTLDVNIVNYILTLWIEVQHINMRIRIRLNIRIRIWLMHTT